MEIVTEFRCDECGFDNATMSYEGLVDAIAAFSVDAEALSDVRPSPEVWSPREYAWHMAAMFDFYGGRIELVLAQDRPRFELREFSDPPPPMPMPDSMALVARLRALTPEQWQRVGISSESTDERDVRILASRLAHECVHHTLDMARSS